MDTAPWILVSAVMLPFMGALAVWGLGSRHPNAREAASLATAILTFGLSAALLPGALSGTPVSTPAMDVLPGFTLQLTADGLGLLFACLASFLWILTTIYSIGYMRGLCEHAQTRYYAFFAAVIGATVGVSFAANLFCLFVFYEILTVATYPLVVHKESEEAFAAGRKYLIYTLTGGLAVLAGMLLLQSMPGALLFVPGGNAAVAAIDPGFARLAFLLLFAGFGVKAAIVPLHGWLPSAMIAPTPVSGLLHAVAVVKAGVFGILRLILFLYGPDAMSTLGLADIVILAAVVTILVGSLLALVQDDFKLRLAYSTVSQLSYIILGAALLVPGGLGITDAGRTAAVIGACFGIAAHAFGKLTMFFVAGAVAVETGKTRVSELNGLGRRMPLEFGAFTLAVLSMAGLPPMAGFITKWYLSVGAWSSGDWWILIVLAVSGVLNLAYFLPIVFRAFLHPYAGGVQGARITLAAPLTVTALGALVLGLVTVLPGGPFVLADLIAGSVTHAAVIGPAAVAISPVVPPFLIFLIGGPLVFFLKGKARQAFLVLIGALALADVLLLPGGYGSGGIEYLGWQLPFMNYTLTLLRVDSLSYLMGVIFGLITFFAILYVAVLERPRLQGIALLYAGTSMGAVFAGDWITLLVFWELMAITSTLLIWQEGGEAVGAGYRYFLFHALGGGLLGAGIALLFLGGGSPVVGPLAAVPAGTLAIWSGLFISLGIGVNICFIPLHTWLPDAYPRAHFAASVFLSVYTTKAAVYLLARAQPGSEFIALMGALMAVYGVTFAVFQNDMRRLLSYHIISQVGYMVAGVGLIVWGAHEAGALGFDGGMAHVFNHILYKALLFMTIGVVIWKTGENLLSRVGGLQKKMPFTALAFWIAAFSISGVPLFNGYISKGMVITAAEHVSPLIWILLEIASFGTFVSFLKMGYFAFLREGTNEATDPPLLTKAGMMLTAALCVLIGVYPALLYGILPLPVAYDAWDPIRFGETILVLGAAALFFFTVGKKVLAPHETRLRDVDVVYQGLGRTVVTLAGGMQEGFGAIYGIAGQAADGLRAIGRNLMALERPDVNLGLAGFAVLLVAAAALLLGVGV